MKITLSKTQATLLRLVLEEERETRVKRALDATGPKRVALEQIIDEMDKVMKQLPELK